MHAVEAAAEGKVSVDGEEAVAEHVEDGKVVVD